MNVPVDGICQLCDKNKKIFSPKSNEKFEGWWLGGGGEISSTEAISLH
jgi:hypothetical protein